MNTVPKTWTVEMIKFLLANNRKAVEHGLLRLYERQTSEEQRAKDTKVHNNRGFTQADAPFFSKLAEEIKAGKRLNDGVIAWLRKGKSTRYPSRIGKYARQLAEIANDKIAAHLTRIDQINSDLGQLQFASDFAAAASERRSLEARLMEFNMSLEQLTPKKVIEAMEKAKTPAAA